MIGNRDSGCGVRDTGVATRGSGLGTRLSRCLAATWLLGVTLQVPRLLAAEPQTVTFTARDGVQVSAVLHVPEKTPAPAVVLLTMLGRTHRDWDAAAARFVEAGIAVLCVDFRQLPLADPDAVDSARSPYAALVLDAEAARAYLAARPEVNPARIGMAGASLGANVAVLAAANDPSVRSLVLLSVSLDYRGLKLEQALKTFASRPALLVASSEDPFALRSARQAVTMGDGARELRVLSGAGHGTVMLAREPDLAAALVDWFLRTLL
jgi:dienelactone hydrolase